MQVYNNSPQIGYIEWEDLNIAYQGVNYAIDDGFTQNLFVWWDPGISTTSLQAGNALPDPFPDDGVVVFLNKNGTHVLVPGASVVQGSLIVQESILANALAANSVTSDKILAGAILSEKIGAGEVQAINLAAGSVTTSKIEAGAITSNEIAANAVTANEIAAGAVTATQLATDAIQSLNYSPPNGSSEPFSQQGSFFKLDDGDIITPGLVVDGDSGDVAVRGDVTATSLTVRNTVDDSEPMLIANSDDPQASDTRNRLLLRTSFSDASDGALEWGYSPFSAPSGNATRARLQAPVRNHSAVTSLDPAHVALDARSDYSAALINAGRSSGNTHFSEVRVLNMSTGDSGDDAAYATMGVGYGVTAYQARVHLSALSVGTFLDLDADTINLNSNAVNVGSGGTQTNVRLRFGSGGQGFYSSLNNWVATAVGGEWKLLVEDTQVRTRNGVGLWVGASASILSNLTIFGHTTFSPSGNWYWNNPGGGSLQTGWLSNRLRFRFGGNATPQGIRLTSYNTARIDLNREGSIYNSLGVYGTMSDERLKQDIVDANNQLDDVRNLRFVNYRLRSEVEELGEAAPRLFGLIAQEVAVTSPHLVRAEEGEPLTVKSSVLALKAVKALQELADRVDALAERIAALEAA